MSKECPILFNAPMVLAVLAGSKSQTRRIVKPDPGPYWNPVVGSYNPTIIDNGGYDAPGPEIFGASDEIAGRKFPYGRPGSHLWLRETFFAFGRWETRFSDKKKRDEWHFVDMTTECDRVYQFAADNPDLPLAIDRGGAMPGWYKRPAIFMPRAASRILLEIVSARVERLNDCSEADAKAEGVAPNWIGPLDKGPNGLGGEGWPGDDYRHYTNGTDGDPAYSARESFESLWESINGVGAWAANPWVWVIEFKRVAS